MAHRVVVIASGGTERRALPHLLAHLEAQGVALSRVRTPARNRLLDVEQAEKLVRADWFANPTSRPRKFVVLVDTDRAEPRLVVEPFAQDLPPRLTDLDVDILFAHACQHLESWYFADAQGLRAFLGRNLGAVDPADPDGIDNPKRHLRNLLGDRVYTAGVSEEIAGSLDTEVIGQRSPSFAGLVAAVINGETAAPGSGR